MRMRLLIVVLLIGLLPVGAMADDRTVRLFAPQSLIETGLFGYALPRFSLKTQVRVELVDSPDEAQVALGDTGTALFEGAGQVWHMHLIEPDHSATKRLADWLTSEVGKNTVTGFAPDGAPLFSLPTATERQVAVIEMDGDAVVGLKVSKLKCARCHAVDDDTRMTSIGSTPSFSVLRALGDWEARFSAFYVLNPHPAFTVIEGVTEPFPIDRPSPIVPVELTLDEVEAVLAYVAAMAAADLGSPLVHQ